MNTLPPPGLAPEPDEEQFVERNLPADLKERLEAHAERRFGHREHGRFVEGLLDED